MNAIYYEAEADAFSTSTIRIQEPSPSHRHMNLELRTSPTLAAAPELPGFVETSLRTDLSRSITLFFVVVCVAPRLFLSEESLELAQMGLTEQFLLALMYWA